MELSEFLVNPKTVDFRGLSITYNADAFTPDFLRKAAKRYRATYKPLIDAVVFEDAVASEAKDKKEAALENIEKAAVSFEETADSLEADRAIYAALLAGTEDFPVIMEWDLTRDGVPVPITEEELLKLKPQIVKDMWLCVRDAASPKSPEIQTAASQTISENTKLRSPSQETPTVTDRTM